MKFILSTSVALAVLVCLGMFSYFQMLKQKNDEHSVARGYAVLRTLQSVRESMLIADQGHEELLFSGNESHRAQATAAALQGHRAIEERKTLPSNDPRERELIRQMQSAVGDGESEFLATGEGRNDREKTSHRFPTDAQRIQKSLSVRGQLDDLVGEE